jgi:hypothetical protein
MTMGTIEQVVQGMIDFNLDEDSTIGDLLINLRKRRKAVRDINFMVQQGILSLSAGKRAVINLTQEDTDE